MRSRLGVVCVLLGLFAAGVAAAAIRAANPTDPPTTTSLTDSTSASTTGTTETLPATTAATTSQPVPSTAIPPPPARPTRRPAAARAVMPVSPRIDGACLLVGAVALHRPGHALQVLGPILESRNARDLLATGIAYPADGSVVTSSAIDLATSGCKSATGTATVRALSLFGGAIRAQRVALEVGRRRPAATSTIIGLEIEGRPIRVAGVRPIALRRWGYALALPPGPISFGRRVRADGGLLVHLLRPRVGLPAGTTLLVTFAGLTPGSARLLDLPLKVTPPLGLRHYVFPVAGPSEFVDTYGAFRTDVPGRWHHGDDIFAALGTPVVAVADGTLNRAGWEKIGGWRLWVRDRVGNEFYYAHLSGYAPQVLHSTRVQAGEVIGFIGNTGDAFTTSPHLHFEIHPRPLLHLAYNGAVDPTNYLLRWRHVAPPRAPVPVHPPFPVGPARRQASFVWRELLTVRGIIRPRHRLAARALTPPRLAFAGDARIAAPAAASSSAARPRPRWGPSAWLLAALLAAAGPAGLAAVLFARRRRT